MRILPPKGLPTPFGGVTLPEMRTPILGPPSLDERRRRAVSHAVATDLAGVFGLIPYVGNLVGGQLADLHFAEVKKLLTPQELDKFIEVDKKIPSNGLAMLYSFVRGA